jgi:hypothetical protein
MYKEEMNLTQCNVTSYISLAINIRKIIKINSIIQNFFPSVNTME